MGSIGQRVTGKKRVTEPVRRDRRILLLFAVCCCVWLRLLWLYVVAMVVLRSLCSCVGCGCNGWMDGRTKEESARESAREGRKEGYQGNTRESTREKGIGKQAGRIAGEGEEEGRRKDARNGREGKGRRTAGRKEGKKKKERQTKTEWITKKEVGSAIQEWKLAYANSYPYILLLYYNNIIYIL